MLNNREPKKDSWGTPSFKIDVRIAFPQLNKLVSIFNYDFSNFSALSEHLYILSLSKKLFYGSIQVPF